MANFDVTDDLLEQIEACSTKVTQLPDGSKERAVEMDNYLKLVKQLSDMESVDDKYQLEKKKFEEQLKKDVKDEKSGWKKFWIGTGITIGTTGLSYGMYLLMLKYNMAFGSLQGRDSKGFIGDIAKIKAPKE